MGTQASPILRPVVFFHDHPEGATFDPNPSETARREIELCSTPPQTGAFASVGWRQGGLEAASMAAAMSTRVDRLVLCCVPAPIDAVLEFDPTAISAKTLLLFGQADAEAPAKHAHWWKDHISGPVRIEMVPRAGNDIIGPNWGRVLSHAAPGALRRA